MPNSRYKLFQYTWVVYHYKAYVGYKININKLTRIEIKQNMFSDWWIKLQNNNYLEIKEDK